MRLDQRFVIISIVVAVVFLITANAPRIQRAAPMNPGPIAVDDSYTVHRSMIPLTPSVLANDSGNNIKIVSIVTNPQHGGITRTEHDINFAAHAGYVGPDSFVYRICDTEGQCAQATVYIDIVNQNPVAVEDARSVVGVTDLGSLLANDFDPDGDPVNQIVYFVKPAYPFPAHGNIQTYESVPGSKNYDSVIFTPTAGYVGSDSFTYKACDNLNACSPPVTVSLFIISDGLNDGAVKCNTGVGRPVNVTNGNVYLHQTDYQPPGVGYAIDVTRTYNSNSQRIGPFGRSWSTAYDESIVALDNSVLRFNRADGRAFYFGRPVGSSSPFAPLLGDFHGSLVPSGSGYTLTMKDRSFRQFNSAGKLLALTDRNGNQTSLAYDGSGKLVSVTDPFGRVLTFTNNASGRVLSISDAMGTIATYTYSVNNQLLSVTYADNSRFQFVYDGAFRLTSVTDAVGNILEAHTYDAQSRALTSEAHGGVERYVLQYTSATETRVTDALGHVAKYTFDKSKQRSLVTKVEGLCSCGGSQVQTWTYDSQSNVTSETDALNHTTSYTYDANGNRLTETDATGTISYTFNEFGDVLSRTDQMNGLTTIAYDAAGNPLTAKDAFDNTSTFTYNSRGQLLTATDARGKVTTFTYDAVGNLTQRKDANSIVTFYFYDARARLTKIRDGLSRSTLFAFDAAGRLNKVTHPDLSFVGFTYDLAGRRIKVTDERGNPTNSAYDSAYRLTSVTDAAGQTTRYAYDAMSNLTSATDPLSRVTDYQYDDFNRLVKIFYPSATQGAPRLFEATGYDALGNVTQKTDTAGRSSHFTYDASDRLLSSTDADNKTTRLEYDALSRTTAVVDALNQRYEFGYDALGRPTSTTRGNATMTYAYDAVGNRVQRTDYNGTTTTYAYDSLNRLTTISYPTRTVTYGYTVMSQLSRATNENGSVYIGYDNRYRVSSFSDPFYYGISYNYDAAGNRIKLSLNGATYATYTYDAVNRLTNLKDNANQNFSHAYDVANRLTTRSAPNGVVTTYSFDGLDRLTSLAHTAGASTVGVNQYTYNDAHNISAWANTAGNHTYNYDLVDRLTSATNNAQVSENYSYDGVGNRVSSHQSETFNYQPVNRLTNSANASYTYDNNGNLMSRTDSSGTTSFSWNEENQLTQSTLPGGLIVTYKYDGLGRRIQRLNSAGASERYVYDGNDVLLDLNADWSVATKFLSGPGVDNHLRQTNALTGVSYYLTDHLGSTAALTDSSGNLLEQVTYDSFGKSNGSTRTRYGYTGRERDPDTGLMYYRARWYDPEIGRFVSEDPIGLGGGINSYAYVSNNPQNSVDPSGQHEIDVHYYLTYYLAIRTGCFSSSEASQIASSTQRVDETPGTAPLFGSTTTQLQTNTLYHALHPGSHLPYLQAHWQLASMGPKGYLPGLGIFLHYLQDMFSHEGFTDPKWGHSPRHGATHYTDKTEYDVPRTMRMAHATWGALVDFGIQTRRCGCVNKAEPQMWEMVESFARIPSGDFYSVRIFSMDEGHPFFLDNKVKILDVPPYVK